jgi:hypothetical protein
VVGGGGVDHDGGPGPHAVCGALRGSEMTIDTMSAGRKQSKPNSHHKMNGRPLLDAIAPGIHASAATTTIQITKKTAGVPDEVVVYVV